MAARKRNTFYLRVVAALIALMSFGGNALAIGHPHGKHRGGRHKADGEVDEEPVS